MERVYAFTDESGAFGWDFNNRSVSTHFIITAILVKEDERIALNDAVEAVRKKHFQTGEMKSSHVGPNHSRRIRVLNDLMDLPFNAFSVVVDKRKIDQSSGLGYKQSFYKFTNNIVHKELTKAFPILTVVADEIGGSEYMKSFSSYFAEKQDIPNLLGEANLVFENSANNALIQLADFIGGSLAAVIDENRKTEGMPNFLKILEKKIVRIEWYPKDFSSYLVDTSALAEDYDKTIATLCLRQAEMFLKENQHSDDDEIRAQKLILEYLVFRFINNDLRQYISTRELKNYLQKNGFGEMSTQAFRTKIIGKMRDKGVIISGSSAKKGYKIPAKEAELFDFINHGTSIILPMLARLKTCRDIVKLGTNNEVDLFDKTEYASLKRYFDD